MVIQLNRLTAAGPRALLTLLVMLAPVFAHAHPGHDHTHGHMLMFAWAFFGVFFLAGFFIKLRKMSRRKTGRLIPAETAS